MSGQNPTIPVPTQSKGIDAVIFDIQTALDLSLSWLTNGMGRAYRLTKVRTPQNIVFLPEVFLGTAQNKYFAATPDNDKIGQNVFLLGTETLPNQQNGFFGILEYDCSILFTANLNLIDSTLLDTEDFTEHLIMEVRQVLLRNLLGKKYKLEIDSIERGFEETYSDFDISNDRGIAHLPLTHFRVNLTIQLREDCAGTTLNKCQAITQNLTITDLLTCVLPLYNFADAATQVALSAQQESDLTNYLCTPLPVTCPNILTFIAPVRGSCIIPSLAFETGNNADFNALSGAQVSDLSDRICTPVVPIIPASVIFDGVNETISAPNNAVYDFANSSPFTVSIWFKTTDVSVLRPIFSKRVNINKGYAMSVGGGKANIILYGSNTLLFWVEANITILNNTWYNLTISHDGTMTLAGIKIYLNAVSQSTTLVQNNIGVTTIQSGASIAIARNSQTGTAYFLGNIWLTRIWNIALSQLSVTADYNAKSTPTAPATNLANLVFGWRGGENARWATVAIPVFVEETGLIIYPAIAGANLELADLTTDIPI